MIYDKDLNEISRIKLLDGHGPRHLDFSNGKVYCLNELKSTLSILDYNSGSLILKETISVLPEDYTGQSTAAAIRSKDGFIYTSNRGHNSISVLKPDEDSVKLIKTVDCAQKLYEQTGNVDVLVLNASVQYRQKWDKITLNEFDAQINCNFRSALLLIQKYANKMCENNWGRIITIGSVQERIPHPDMLVYSSAKAALSLMAKSLALQFAKDGVTVNSVAPGVIYTDRNTEALSDKTYAQSVVSKIPMGFCGEASDCAGIIDFLCTDDARYITGQNIFVDGGMGIK